MGLIGSLHLFVSLTWPNTEWSTWARATIFELLFIFIFGHSRTAILMEKKRVQTDEQKSLYQKCCSSMPSLLPLRVVRLSKSHTNHFPHDNLFQEVNTITTLVRALLVDYFDGRYFSRTVASASSLSARSSRGGLALRNCCAVSFLRLMAFVMSLETFET